MTPTKKPRARTRWAVEWRYPGGKAWRLYASWPGRDDAEMAREMCAFQHPTREWRVYLKLGRAKSKLTPSKRRARATRSLKRDQWLTARTAALERDGGCCVRCSLWLFNEENDRQTPHMTKPAAEVHHIISRRYLRTRCDLSNLVSLCLECHRWYHQHPVAGLAWFAATYPERHAYLVQLEQEVAQQSGKVAGTEARYPEATEGPVPGPERERERKEGAL